MLPQQGAHLKSGSTFSALAWGTAQRMPQTMNTREKTCCSVVKRGLRTKPRPACAISRTAAVCVTSSGRSSFCRAALQRWECLTVCSDGHTVQRRSGCDRQSETGRPATMAVTYKVFIDILVEAPEQNSSGTVCTTSRSSCAICPVGTQVSTGSTQPLTVSTVALSRTQEQPRGLAETTQGAHLPELRGRFSCDH